MPRKLANETTKLFLCYPKEWMGELEKIREEMGVLYLQDVVRSIVCSHLVARQEAQRQ